jgi:uncharacterized protein (TIGR03437 family)
MSLLRCLSGTTCLLAVAAFSAYAQPTIAAIVNGASFEPVVAPGSLVAIFGKGLAQSTQAAPGGSLPTSLAGTSVKIGAVMAPLYYVSDTQVNAVVPAETAIAGSVPVVVTAAAGSSLTFNLKVDRCGPAIFTRSGNGQGRAIVFDARYVLADSVKSGDIVSFYATGLGSTTIAPDGYTRAVITPAVYIGESPATVLYAGPSGFPGVYQVNVTVPAPLATERFYMVSAGSLFPSNMSEIGIPTGQNTQNASGKIGAVYPVDGSRITYSPVLTAAMFKAQFDIAPRAVSFTVAAVGDAGSIVFVVDPVAWRITGRSQVPTAAQRAGDFSFSNPGYSVIDFTNGFPMPGMMVPVARMDPVAMAATSSIPFPNVPPGDLTNFVYDNQLPSSGTVVLDDSISANSFGNFLSIPYAPYLSSRSTGFKLYIDGKVIDSQSVTYTLPTPAPPVASSLTVGAQIGAATVRERFHDMLGNL